MGATARLRDQADKSRSAVAGAVAQTRLGEATVREAELALQRLRGIARLNSGGLPARAELDAAEAALERARASVAGAAADTLQARAALHADETNLAKASIRSPIDGVVLARKIEPGQTVAASLQAPVLFTIAQTLSQMELDVDVDEADVGGVREGMEATFTVDACPARPYRARVRRVDLGSQVKDGVVSYVAVLDVDNGDLSLRPGMTATAEIVTAVVHDAVLVPSAALRFAPEDKPAAQESGSLVECLLPRMPLRLFPGPARRASGSDRSAAARTSPRTRRTALRSRAAGSGVARTHRAQRPCAPRRASRCSARSRTAGTLTRPMRVSRTGAKPQKPRMLRRSARVPWPPYHQR
jgi:HlyD family secretion protein